MTDLDNLDAIAVERMDDRFRLIFPDIFEKDARTAILGTSTLMELKAGDIWLDVGAYIKSVPLVLEGTLKLVREDEKGHEMLLYYIHPGQTCALSLSCCSGSERSTIRVVAEEDTTLLAVPVRSMDEWTTNFRSWKQFVLKTYRSRIEDLVKTIDGLAFQGLDQRIMANLKEKRAKQASPVIQITHQELANDMNSSREVISRILKRLENEGLVKLGRQRIELLERLAQR